ncbi:hypothetical protein DSECCO2_563600 [anaerobic digester metagenome]
MRNSIVVQSLVSRGTDDQCRGCIDRISQRLVVIAPAPGAADDIRTHHGCILDSKDCIRILTIPVRAEELKRHDRCVPHNSRNALSVVPYSGNGSGAVSTMAMEVIGVVVVIIKVPTINIIDISVAVIIDPVAGNLSRVLPYIRSKVRVGIHNPGIDDGNDYILRPRGDGPCL